MWENPYYNGSSTSYFMRGGNETGKIVYCAQGYLASPEIGQPMVHYGWLGIPELDYVLYHGYDGEVVTSVGGLDAARSEAATVVAVWLAIGEQRGDVLSYLEEDGLTYHGNRFAEDRWEILEDPAVKQAARSLYDRGLAYKNRGGGGPEEQCSTFWANRNAMPNGYQWYQGVVSVRKRISVEFEKTSADVQATGGNSEYSVAGASYDIFDAQTNEKVASITTDGQGRATCELQPNKSYYAVETKAPAGFVMNPERVEFSVSLDGGTVVLTDRPGSVRLSIRKVDSATGGGSQAGTSLAGAKFRVSSLSTPGWQTTATTNAEGTCTVDGIPLGKLSVVETKAPEGYKLNPTAQTLEVKAGSLPASGVALLESTVAETIRSFDFDLVKYRDSGAEGSGLQQPAAGVRFEIMSNSSKKVVGTLTTDERGYASTANSATVNAEAVSPSTTYDASKPWMGAGKRTEAHVGALPYDSKGYTVREVASTTPEGYQPCSDWIIDAGQQLDGTTLHYIVDNDFVASRIQVVKTDTASGQTVALPGFAFQLLDHDKQPVTQEVWYPNHEQIDTFTTDGTGCVTFPEALKPGTYYVREVGAVAPYLRGSDDIKIDIANDSSAPPITVVQARNVQAEGVARIIKRCSDEACAWCEAPDEVQVLDGAEFDVVALEDIVSPDGAIQAATGQVMDHVTTSEGTVETKPLPLGPGTARYAFVETKAPAGHRLDPTPLPFTLTWEDDATETVHAEVTAYNEPTETRVSKMAAGTDTPVAGVRFGLWPDALEFSSTYDSEDTGALVLACSDAETCDNLAFTCTRVYDTACVELRAPDSYAIYLEDERGAAVLDPSNVAPGAYQLIVVDGDGSEVVLGDESRFEVEAGKRYSLTYKAGVLGWGAGLSVESADQEAPSYTKEDLNAFGTSGCAFELGELAPGRYEVRLEHKGEESLVRLDIGTGRRSFAHLDDNGLTARSYGLDPRVERALETLFEDFGINLVTNEDGLIELRHLPARGADAYHALRRTMLAGDMDDQEVAEVLAGLAEAGQIAWRIQEQEAPEGFLVDPRVRTFTIHDDGMTEGVETYELDVKNDFTKVEVHKRDAETEEELEGAHLALVREDGETYAEWVSEPRGRRFDRLAPGTYTLREIRAPEGHDAAPDVEFEVLPIADVQHVTMYDTPIRIAGEIDKRQEIADPVAANTVENGDGENRATVHKSEDGIYSYSLDFRSTSNTWVDECTVEDSLQAVDDGFAELLGLTTGQVPGDHDEMMNVWYRTNRIERDDWDEQNANATVEDGHPNPWLEDEEVHERLGDDLRKVSYEGWRLWRKDVPTTKATTLCVDDLELDEGELVTGVRFEYGRVNEAFSTRPDEWDRDDLKHPHDDVNGVAKTHGEEFAVGDSKEAYAPAIFHMRVGNAYQGDAKLDNAAFIDLVRNGGGEGLEAHDEDYVTQTAKTEPQEPEEPPAPSEPPTEPPRKPAQPMPKTGDSQALAVASCTTIGVMAIAAGIVRHRRRLR